VTVSDTACFCPIHNFNSLYRFCLCTVCPTTQQRLQKSPLNNPYDRKSSLSP
jgi:hypothetical protein